jgi:hypothetical protein
MLSAIVYIAVDNLSMIVRGYIAGRRSFDAIDPAGVRIEFVPRASIAIKTRTLHPEAVG